MTTFLHTADWHLGSPQHPAIYKEQLLPAFSKILQDTQTQVVLCVGDVFDVHNPDQKTKDALLKFLVESHCTFLFVVGNHDFSDKTRTYHSLEYLKILAARLDNVSVYDQSGIYKVAIDGYVRQLLVIVDDAWSAVQDYPLTGPVDIVAWHGTVPGISFTNGVEYKKDGQIEAFIKKSGCKYFALGDIHKHLQLNKRCWYPGALVQKTYGCEAGVVHVSFDQKTIKTTSLKLDLPEKKNLNVTFEIGKDSEKSIIAFVRDNVAPKSLIRLIFNLPMSAWAGLNKDYIRKELVEFHDVKLDNLPRVDVVKRTNFENIKQCKSTEEELKMLIDQEELDIDKDDLLTLCKEYL